MQEHNQGLTKSIKFQLPFILEYSEVYETRINAIKREKFLKSGKGREWLDNNVKSLTKENKVGV